MKKDDIFKKSAIPTDFEFNKEISETFDDMAERSIPFYKEVQNMSASLALLYYQPKTHIYDLGFSTGNMLLTLSNTFSQTSFSYIGIDNSREMVDFTLKKIAGLPIQHHIKLVVQNVSDFAYENASVIIVQYIFQFLRPMERLPVMRKLFSSLRPGGILLFSEKVLEKEGNLSRQFIHLYHEFKKKRGYTKLEIVRKRESLENVLIPYRVEENIELMLEAGFDQADIFFKWFNFTSFIALKKA